MGKFSELFLYGMIYIHAELCIVLYNRRVPENYVYLHFINEEPGATTSSKTHSWTGDINCVNPSTFLLAE